jgi:two-component system chemotaxis response regulator CheY
MPEMKGLDALKELRASGNNIKIIMITFLEDETYKSVKEEAEGLGVYCMLKPLTREKVSELFSIIEDWRAFK